MIKMRPCESCGYPAEETTCARCKIRGCTKDSPIVISDPKPFEHNGVIIADPFLDESGIDEVNPIEYYKRYPTGEPIKEETK
jgi:hypothetical protein